MGVFVLKLPLAEIINLVRFESSQAYGAPELNMMARREYLIEEDFDSAMFIYRGQNSEITGEIFDYENYEFFGKTYKNKASETISFVQPASIKISGDRFDSKEKMAGIQPFFGPGILYNTIKAGIAVDRKSTRLNSSHVSESRMPSSA